MYYFGKRKWDCISNDIRELDMEFEYSIPVVDTFECIYEILEKNNLKYRTLNSINPTVVLLSIFDEEDMFVCYIYLSLDFMNGRVYMYIVDNGSNENDKMAIKLSGNSAYEWNSDFRNVFEDTTLMGE